MKILIVGNGAREHALGFKIKKEDQEREIYFAPGNAGTKNIGKNIDIKSNDINELRDFAYENKIDLTIIGPEIPLSMGIVDLFNERDLKIIGPNKVCSQLEASKSFCKEFLIRNNLKTANYQEANSFESAMLKLEKFKFPVVIKADGLAAGKGVFICKTKEEAVSSLESLMLDKIFKEAGEKIIIEEYLQGIEASLICFVDEDTILPLQSAQDYKRALDYDLGENTGGMGSYSPSIIYPKFENKVKTEILEPLKIAFKKENLKYKGILFIGLMIVKEEIYILEFNVRFGDPETQSLMLRLKTDIIEVFNSIDENNLKNITLEWDNRKSICVNIVSQGYPQKYEINKTISIDEKLQNDIIIFHGGTKYEDDILKTTSGRVLSICTLADSLRDAREKVYKNLDFINFEGKFYRKDIGQF